MLTINQEFLRLLETFSPRELGKKFTHINNIGTALDANLYFTHVPEYVKKRKEKVKSIKKRILTRLRSQKGATDGFNAGRNAPSETPSLKKLVKYYINKKIAQSGKSPRNKRNRQKAEREYNNHLHPVSSAYTDFKRNLKTLGAGVLAGGIYHLYNKHQAKKRYLYRKKVAKVGASIGAGVIGAYGLKKYADYKRKQREDARKKEKYNAQHD